mmetsp:Transcript_48097/g.71279  ORF Transcript_48097/g.71279 Transcript_48097/m.71279 type:complete len:484 (-) Transcript_48097:533-1984(-)|eukprot:CAMPEP_0195515866 /NCGR_PEP_ID=MMETSP0794_2-20130614/6773_1 /TAXON_ID=515487 /ORGANISM="Stephanopyxis turris, Strain CCMP 815" /LENGTH=483 /DNA_ID=CAMNT_0040644355 /DNA_START=17 /DNA_END=1471 /DNA_ORIENTATION=-
MTNILRIPSEDEINPKSQFVAVQDKLKTIGDEASTEFDLATNTAYLILCNQQGIPTEVAKLAEKESRERNKKWWGHGGISQWLSERTRGKRLSSSESEVDEQIVWSLQQKPLPPNVAESASILEQTAKSDALTALRDSLGDITNPHFVQSLKVLSSIYLGYGRDSRTAHENDGKGVDHDGSWVSLSRPSFPGCLGNSIRGDYMYSLGRMSFDMFLPTRLKCSIQHLYNEVKLVDGNDDLPESIPKALLGQLTRNKLRKYNIVIHFTIEPRTDTDSEASQETPAPSSPIRGVMTNNGYMLPDPGVPNRFNIWFTGGELGPYLADKSSPLSPSVSSSTCSLTLHQCRYKNRMCALHGLGTNTVTTPLEWEEIFGKQENWKRTLGERAKMLAAQMLLGADVPEQMEEDGTMNYELHRPISGHIDVLYMDEDLRITKGNYGTIQVQARTKVGEDARAEFVPQTIPPPLPTVLYEEELFPVGMDLDDF